MSERAQITDNPAREGSRPALSVLVPFLRDDPSELLALLDAEAAAVGGAVEIVVLDDGTADAGLTQRLVARIQAMAERGGS